MVFLRMIGQPLGCCHHQKETITVYFFRSSAQPFRLSFPTRLVIYVYVQILLFRLSSPFARVERKSRHKHESVEYVNHVFVYGNNSHWCNENNITRIMILPSRNTNARRRRRRRRSECGHRPFPSMRRPADISTCIIIL